MPTVEVPERPKAPSTPHNDPVAVQDDTDPAWGALATRRPPMVPTVERTDDEQAPRVAHAPGEPSLALDATLTLPEGKNEGSGIPVQFLVWIQGNPFVKFAGLLQLAHERGLVGLSEAWTYNDAELSLAHAVARFSDGLVFEGCGDATPRNVTKKVAPHFRRVALTRAKARALRDALNVDLVAAEELGDE